MDRAGSPLAPMTQFMSWIRATRESLSSAPNGEVLTVWGTKGSGDGQFDDPASVAVDPATNKVYVADPRNKRIQVFDSDGKFLTKWIVPEWGGPYGFEDLAIDSSNGRLYASSTNMNAVLIFDLNGNRIGSVDAEASGRTRWAIGTRSGK